MIPKVHVSCSLVEFESDFFCTFVLRIKGNMRPPTQYPQEIATEAAEEPDPRLGAMMICTRLAGRAVIRVVGRCNEAKENEHLGKSQFCGIPSIIKGYM